TSEDYRQWSDDLAKAGVMLCVPTQWHGRPVLRLAFVNPESDPAQVLTVLRETLTPDHHVPA
ncbi:MAG: hypothetical protein KDI48_20535, partial [Xanthomonadales bacterium]|nr:hypothetical protein [Xanthomonadales bacterium]